MKKTIFILSSLFLTSIMQAQIDRKQPIPGPIPTVNVGKPVAFTLDNGLKVMIVENRKQPRVSFTLHFDNPPFTEGTKKGVDDLTSSLLGNGTQKTSKAIFNEEIDFLGARIDFSSKGTYASALSKYADRVLELMAEGCLEPVFTQDELDKERAKLVENIRSNEKNVSSISRRVEDVLAFGKKHPFGEYTTEQSLNKVQLKDVVANYTAHFVPENAYLVILGDLNIEETKKKVLQLFGGWRQAKAPKITSQEPKDVAQTQINIVDMPNAVQSEITVVNLVDLKISDRDYFPSIIANQILGGGGEGRLFLNLREKHGWTYGAYSTIGSGKYISKFRASTSVRNEVTDSAIVQLLYELKKIRIEAVSEEELATAKAKYIGNFVMQMEKPQTIARYALNVETQYLPHDFYENYIHNINEVTAADVLRVAQKYIQPDRLRILVVGKKEAIRSGLYTLNIPIHYFDKFGNAVKK